MVFVVSSFALVHSLYQHTWLAKWQSQPCVLIKRMNMWKGWFRFIRSAILKQFWRGAGYRFCGPDTQHKHLLSSPGREISKRVDARKKGSENVPKSDCNRPDDPEPRRLHHRGAERYKCYTSHFKMFIILIYITSLLLEGDFYSSASATASLGNTSSWLSPSSSQSHAVAATHVLKLNERLGREYTYRRQLLGWETRVAFKVWDITYIT